jgi:aspartate dehydrogenase
MWALTLNEDRVCASCYKPQNFEPEHKPQERNVLNITIIGYGAIGRYVCAKLRDISGVQVKWVLCREGRESHARAVLGDEISAVTEIPTDASLAIECAGHGALAQHGPTLLASSIDVLTVSTGAMADRNLAAELADAARRGNAQLTLLSGAVGGIDALSAARNGGLDHVTYRGRKPPSGWQGSAADDVLDLARITRAETHFTGSARDAALKYPKNANVAATIALAGLGLDETNVELIADPALSRNIHEIEATGAFGRFNIQIEGNPLPDNPRSSALAAMSIVRAIQRKVEPVVV